MNLIRLIIFFIICVTSIAQADNYQNITILAPVNNITYPNNEAGNVDVTIKLSPQLQPRNKLQIILDGKADPSLFTTTSFTLKNIDRGEHHLQVQILDANGKIIMKSKSVTFFMHRPMIKKP